jgi:two-component system response regulator BaeR
MPLTKLLVVDDEPDVGHSLIRYLSIRRFQVSVAENADLALKIMEKDPADIVLLDLELKGTNGATIAKYIKDHYPLVKIIIVTAHPDEADALQLEIPLDGVYIKPMGIEDLFVKLSAL